MTPTNAAKEAGRALGSFASADERFDYESVTWSYQHPCEFACALPVFRWWTTRNKAFLFPLVTTFRNNGHDDGEKSVLAPSFPSRREVGDQCSASTHGIPGGRAHGRFSRSTHPRSSAEMDFLAESFSTFTDAGDSVAVAGSLDKSFFLEPSLEAGNLCPDVTDVGSKLVVVRLRDRFCGGLSVRNVGERLPLAWLHAFSERGRTSPHLCGQLVKRGGEQ